MDNGAFVCSSHHDMIDFHHLESVDSTQDEVKRRLLEANPENDNNKLLVVTAQEQSKGRGTSGRTWISLRGNLFMTMGLTMDRVSITPTLLPLQVGVLLTRRLRLLVDAVCSRSGTSKMRSPSVNVKWPNDILMDGEKVAGILIESQVIDGTIWLLIGIGVNLQAAPMVPSNGPQRGRPATSVQRVCQNDDDDESSKNKGVTLIPIDTNVILAEELAVALHDWLVDPSTTSSKTVEDWKALADWTKPLKLRETGEEVLPIDLASDGQLLVRSFQDGRERHLIADYLY